MTKREALIKITGNDKLSYNLASGKDVRIGEFTFKFKSEKLKNRSYNDYEIDPRTPIGSYQEDEYIIKVTEGKDTFELVASYSGYVGDLQFDFLLLK